MPAGSGRARGNTNMIAVGWVLLLSAMLWFFVDWNEREAIVIRD